MSDRRVGMVWRTLLGDAVPIIFLGFTIFLVYFRSLPFSFQFDDFRNIVFNPSIHINDLTDIFSANGATVYVGGNRPVAFWTFALNYRFGGLDPWGYRFANILIHWVNAVLVYFLCKQILCQVHQRSIPRWVALGAALLWALHPVHTSAVAYVVQRMTSLATLFYLSGLACYIWGRKKGGWVWFVAAGLFFFFGCRTKEIVFIFPFAILLYECAFTESIRAYLAHRRWIAPAVCMLCLGLFPIVLHEYGASYASMPFTWQERVLTELRVVAHYLSLIVFPVPSRMCADYAVAVSTSLWDPPATALSLLLHVILIGLGVYLIIRRPLFGLSLLGFYLHLAIESTVIPLDLEFEHRLYLPSVFLAFGAGGVVMAAIGAGNERRRTAAVMIAVTVLSILLFGATWRRLDVWRDPVTLWTDVLDKFPESPRAHANLGKVFHERGNLRAARFHLMKAYTLDPTDLRILANMARVEGDEGHWEKAREILLGLIQRGLRDHIVYGDLGHVLVALGDLVAARDAYKNALAIEPRLPLLNLRLAQISWELGDYAGAAEFAQRELEIAPGNADALKIVSQVPGVMR